MHLTRQSINYLRLESKKIKTAKTKLFWKFPEERKMLARLPKCCLKMLFEGNEARSWHTEAGRGATAKQPALNWISFLLTYHFGTAHVEHF